VVKCLSFVDRLPRTGNQVWPRRNLARSAHARRRLAAGDGAGAAQNFGEVARLSPGIDGGDEDEFVSSQSAQFGRAVVRRQPRGQFGKSLSPAPALAGLGFASPSMSDFVEPADHVRHSAGEIDAKVLSARIEAMRRTSSGASTMSHSRELNLSDSAREAARSFMRCRASVTQISPSARWTSPLADCGPGVSAQPWSSVPATMRWQ
jgi:hypothetical protein